MSRQILLTKDDQGNLVGTVFNSFPAAEKVRDVVEAKGADAWLHEHGHRARLGYSTSDHPVIWGETIGNAGWAAPVGAYVVMDAHKVWHAPKKYFKGEMRKLKKPAPREIGCDCRCHDE